MNNFENSSFFRASIKGCPESIRGQDDHVVNILAATKGVHFDKEIMDALMEAVRSFLTEVDFLRDLNATIPEQRAEMLQRYALFKRAVAAARARALQGGMDRASLKKYISDFVAKRNQKYGTNFKVPH